jgi:hypothetical protein
MCDMNSSENYRVDASDLSDAIANTRKNQEVREAAVVKIIIKEEYERGEKSCLVIPERNGICPFEIKLYRIYGYLT